MESSNHNASRKSLIEEDERISAFRTRNKIIILTFFFLIISLALITVALITTRLHPALIDSPLPRISPIEAYCFVSDRNLCLRALNPIITNKFISNPNQIFAISLHAAAKSLQRITASIPFNNCTRPLRRGSDRIRDAIVTMRVNPFVESLSDEQRGDMLNRISAAEEDVTSCLTNLPDVEAAAPGAVVAQLREVLVCLDAAGDFLMRFGEALQMYEADNVVDRRIISENLLGISFCGLQLLFIFGLYYSLLCRRTR